ncbi:MAG: metallophosphoesterase [Actinomycetota bacterium]|nr:metallophosphoesterase [Actinomycetota bacterium]
MNSCKAHKALIVFLSFFLAIPALVIFPTEAYAFEEHQFYEHEKDLPGTDWEFSFAHFTDLHIGDGIKDYGTPGYDDEPPEGDVGASAEKLRQAVEWVNEYGPEYKIKFVIITGDITDSAEKSEFMKAREILDDLDVPYVPVIGNHDIWGYSYPPDAGGSFIEPPSPVGDRFFREVFADNFERLKSFFSGWDDGTRNTLIHNEEESCDCYFQNFAFDYAGYHFICADFNSRRHAPLGNPGVPGDANLFDSDSCRGTWTWYKEHMSNYPYRAAENVLSFTHQPLCVNPFFTFSKDEYDTITGWFSDMGYRESIGLWMGGHFHMYVPGWSPKLQYEIKDPDGNLVATGIHSKAIKDDPLNQRLVKVWGKTSAPAPWGVILYEGENYTGKSELFVDNDPNLGDNFIADNSASSVRLMGDLKADLFTEPSYSGNKVTCFEDQPTLASLGIDDATSSIRLQRHSVTGIEPTTGFVGETVDAEIYGSGFSEDFSMLLERDGSEPIKGTSVEVESPSKITCAFDLSNAEEGKWDVSVVAPDSYKKTLPEAFTVVKPSEVAETSWYLAEGSTGSDERGSFETWVLIQNPGDEAATAKLTYMTPKGEKEGPTVELAPHSRQTVDVGATVSNEWSVSTRVTSDKPVIAERAMYWNTPTIARQAAHDSIGVQLAE